MSRRFAHILFLILIALTLTGAPAQAADSAEVIALRIPVTDGVRASTAAFKAARVIDYGSFLWVVMDAQDLGALPSEGSTQIIRNPYTLTLGGQSFDPLLDSPSVGALGESANRAKGPGPRLVQFHGPTKASWLLDLENAGLEVIQYIHPFTYLVWGDLDALDRAQARDSVRWAGAYLPAYGVQPQNQALNSDPLLVRVMSLPQADLSGIIRAVEGLGGQLQGAASGADPAFDLTTFLLSGDQIGAVAAIPGVYSVQPVPQDGGLRGEMSSQINVGNVDGSNLAFPGYQDWLNEVGLSGAGVIIANVDNNINRTHPDLVNRLLPCVGSTCGTGVPFGTTLAHGTHTAGIMAGDGSSGVTDSYGFLRGLGMAPGANLIEQAYWPTYLQTNGMLTLMTQSYQNGARISGNSWGPSGSPLGYDLNTRLVDSGVRDSVPGDSLNQQLSFILSINNNINNFKLGTPDEAKNVFSIAATDMQSSNGSQFISINNISNTSAHGPAQDGRNVPHMVAPGCLVDSTIYPGTGYGLLCGTSMASPQVTGAVALFIERYRNLYGADPSPAMVKAAFLPLAHDLAGHLDADGGILGHPFDSKQGWGRLDAAAVLNHELLPIYFDQRTLFDNTGETWTFTLFVAEPIQSLRAMLVWTDAPGHGLGGTAAAWVNDLDFSLTLGGNTYLGNHFGLDGTSITGGSPDGMNNTEGIFLENSPAGTYTFTVTAAQIAGDGVPNIGDDTDQDFALAIYTKDYPYKVIFPIFFH